MVGASKDKALEPRERELLEKNIKDTKHLIIFFLGCYAGLRVSEMIQCRLAWLEWVHIKEKKVLAINIPESDNDIKNKRKKWTPKTKYKRTTYIFDPDKAASVYFWFDNHEDGLMISRQMITTKIVKGKFAKILRRLPQHISTHALRSTFQNYLFFEKNMDIKFCQLVLGHKDDRTTTKHYTSLTKQSGVSYLEGKVW